jgi:hypothetical protein
MQHETAQSNQQSPHSTEPLQPHERAVSVPRDAQCDSVLASAAASATATQLALAAPTRYEAESNELLRFQIGLHLVVPLVQAQALLVALQACTAHPVDLQDKPVVAVSDATQRIHANANTRLFRAIVTEQCSGATPSREMRKCAGDFEPMSTVARERTRFMTRFPDVESTLKLHSEYTCISAL